MEIDWTCPRMNNSKWIKKKPTGFRERPHKETENEYELDGDTN